MADDRPYWQKLRDPRWQRLRTERMTVADFKCERCGADDRTLNVHHRVYRKGKQPWEYALIDLICLCETCHEEEHRWREQLKEVMAKLDTYDIERLCGYAKGLWANHGWDSENVLNLPPITLDGAEECFGMADALGLHQWDEEFIEVFTNELSVSTALGFSVTCSRRHREAYEKAKGGK